MTSHNAEGSEELPAVATGGGGGAAGWRRRAGERRAAGGPGVPLTSGHVLSYPAAVGGGPAALGRTPVVHRHRRHGSSIRRADTPPGKYLLHLLNQYGVSGGGGGTARRPRRRRGPPLNGGHRTPTRQGVGRRRFIRLINAPGANEPV